MPSLNLFLCVCVSLCKTSTKHNTWLWFGSLWIRKLSCNCCWCTKHRYFSKIMWSEVKSRNKFLTINKNNEVHLFDLNSFYIYFVFFFFFIFPSRSLSLSLSLSVLLFFCFPVFVCIHRIAAYLVVAVVLIVLQCFHASFSFKGKIRKPCTSRLQLDGIHNGQNLADIDAI